LTRLGRLALALGAVLAVLTVGAAPVLGVDGTAGTAVDVQTFTGEALDWVQLVVFAMVVGWSLTLFTLGVIVVTGSLRE